MPLMSRTELNTLSYLDNMLNKCLFNETLQVSDLYKCLGKRTLELMSKKKREIFIAGKRWLRVGEAGGWGRPERAETHEGRWMPSR
jgi:hypothetical protein